MRWGSWCSLLAAAALLMGCGGSSGTGQTTGGKVYQITYAGSLPEGDPTTVAMHNFQTLVESQSNHRLVVKLYPNNQLGASADVISQVKSGTIQMLNIGGANLSTLVPEIDALSLPFLFDDGAQAISVLSGPAGATLSKDAESEAGLKFLSYQDFGLAEILNNRHAVTTLEDLKGLKLRTATNQIWANTLTALGVHPTPMAFTDVPTSLRQGVIDGDTLPMGVIYSTKEYQLAPYITVANWTWSASLAIINLAFWKTLPSDLQKIIANAAVQTAKEGSKTTEDNAASYAQQIGAAGGHLVTLTPAERTRWTQIAQPAVIPPFLAKTPSASNLVKELQAANKK